MSQFPPIRPIEQPVEKPKPKGQGVIAGAFDAANSEWTTSFLSRQMRQAFIEPDPSFRLTEDLLTELGDGIDTDMLSGFEKATSLPQAKAIRSNLLEVQQSRQRLAAMGTTGVALQLGAAILDPAFIAAEAAVTLTGVGAPGAAAAAGVRASRIRRMIQGGLVVGGTEAAVEGYLTTQDPSRDVSSILIAAAAGGTLGAGAGYLAGGISKADQAARLLRQFELEDAIEEGFQLTEGGLDHFTMAVDDHNRAFETLIGASDILDDAEAEEYARLLGKAPDTWRGSLNAEQEEAASELIQARANIEGADRLDMKSIPDEIPRAQDATTMRDRVIGRVRYSMAGQLARSRSNIVRNVAVKLADDTLAYTRGVPVRQSASEWKTRQQQRFMTRFYTTAQPEWDKYRKRVGVSWRNQSNDRVLFFEQVTRAIREGVDTAAHPEVAAVARTMQEEQRKLLQLAKDNGVRGFEEVGTDLSYAMRIPSFEKMAKLAGKHGDKAVIRMLQRALIAGSDEIEEELAEKIAKGYYKRIGELERDRSIDKATGRAGVRRDALAEEDQIREILEEEGLEAGQIDTILFSLGRGTQGGEGVPSRARRRVRFDETFVDEETGIRFDEITENDAEALFASYADQMLGTIGADQFLQSMPGSPGSFQTILTRAATELREAGADAKEIESTISKLEVLYRNASGLRIGGNGRIAEAGRQLRGFQFLRVMGQVGMAQLPEYGMLIHRAGFRNVVNAAPELRSIFRRARDGQMGTPLLQEIEALFATGTDWIRHQPLSRFDGTQDSIGTQVGRNLDRRMNRAQKFVSGASGMALVDTSMQRLAMVSAMNKWATIARTGKVPSARRLASIGLDEQAAAKISEQIRKHSTTEAGALTGRRMTQLNIDQWDKATAGRFIDAMQTWSNRTVQRNDIGQMAEWMTTDMGKTLIQFRSFVNAAYEKQLLDGIATFDFETFAAWATASMIAGLAYTAQQYGNSLGRPDAAEFREERLSFDRIAAASFARAGYATLMPAVIDEAMIRTGNDTLFTNIRSSQLATSLFAGNPTVDFLDNFMGGFIRGIVAPPTNASYDFSQEDARNITRAMPFSNIYGVRNITEAFTEWLPETSKED